MIDKKNIEPQIQAVKLLTPAAIGHAEDSAEYTEIILSVAVFAIRILAPTHSKKTFYKLIDTIYESKSALKD